MCGGIREKGDRKMEELKVFNHKEFGELEILIIDGKEYFPATDVASKLGYKDPHKSISQHTKKDGWVNHLVIDSLGRKQKKKFIDEGNLYRLIVSSKLPEAEKFESWVFDEVLPTIRKHGAYMTPETIEQALLNPDTIIQLATNLKEEQKKRKELENENKELKPKATYHDLVLQSDSLLSVTQIAKDFGMGAPTLNKILHELGVQYKKGHRWYLYHQYQDKGYTQSKTYAINAEETKDHMYWTQKGRLFIYEILKEKKGILPNIEKETA